jgi:hypothetical protein
LYVVFGWTATLCEHWASSDEVGVSWSACEPEWVGDETTAPVPESHVHGLSAPVSNPELATRLPVAGGVELALALADGDAGTDGDADGEALALTLALALGFALGLEGVVDPYGLAMIVIVRDCTPQPFACDPGSHTSTVWFWIQVPMSPA